MSRLWCLAMLMLQCFVSSENKTEEDNVVVEACEDKTTNISSRTVEILSNGPSCNRENVSKGCYCNIYLETAATVRVVNVSRTTNCNCTKNLEDYVFIDALLEDVVRFQSTISLNELVLNYRTKVPPIRKILKFLMDLTLFSTCSSANSFTFQTESESAHFSVVTCGLRSDASTSSEYTKSTYVVLPTSAAPDNLGLIVGVAVGVGGGVVLVVVILIIVILILRHRQITSRETGKGDQGTGDAAEMGSHYDSLKSINSLYERLSIDLYDKPEKEEGYDRLQLNSDGVPKTDSDEVPKMDSDEVPKTDSDEVSKTKNPHYIVLLPNTIQEEP